MMIWRGLSAKTIVAAAEAIAQRKSSDPPRREAGAEHRTTAPRPAAASRDAIKAVDPSPGRHAAE